MALQQAHCAVCGEKVLHNPKAAGRLSTKPGFVGQPMTGWHHDRADAAWLGHYAVPHDNRDPADEKIRRDAQMNRARVAVNKTLDQQFLGMQVDDIFRDRR